MSIEKLKNKIPPSIHSNNIVLIYIISCVYFRGIISFQKNSLCFLMINSKFFS